MKSLNMESKIALFIFCLFSLFLNAQTFTWNSLGIATPQTFPKSFNTTVSGITMSVSITANKNGGSAGATYGAASQIGGSGVCAGTPNGLFLEMSGGGTSWTNSITVDITFSVAVTGPVTFTAYDINEAIWGGGGPDSYYCDRLTVSATSDGTTAIAGSAITATGCSGTTNTAGATSTFVEANYTSNGCNCASKTISIGANCTQKVKTIRLVYGNGVPTYVKYGISQFQNIVISSISANNAANPVISATASPSTICSGQSSTLSSSCTSNCTGITYAWTGGTTPTTGTSVSTSPTSTSNYTVTATNSAGCTSTQALTVNVTCALPVELSNFNIDCNVDNLKIEWTTMSERNNDYFILEGSSDALEFKEIGFVNGAGNSQTAINYSFNYNRFNYLYFRLKQVDLDGTITYSNVINANCDTSPINNLTVFPNPFTDNFSITLDLQFSSEVAFHVINQQGQIVSFIEKKCEKGITILDDFLPSQLEKGVYFIKVIDEKNQLNQSVKVVKI